MLTPEQHAERAKGLGASDVPAILGLDPFKTAADILATKLYPMGGPDILDPDWKASEAAEIGTYLEPGILALCGARLGRTVVKPPATYWAENGVMLANLDGQLDRAAIDAPIVEAKNTGLVANWGDPALGAEAVPQKVLAQVYAQFVCTKAEVAYVTALFARFGQHFAIYEVPRDAEVCGLVEERVLAWHRRHIVNRDPLPLDAPPPSVDVLRRIYREPNKVVPVDGDAVLAWREAAARESAAREACEAAKARVLMMLGDAEAGECQHGRVTYFTQRRKSYTVPESEYRVCRFVAAKGEVK